MSWQGYIDNQLLATQKVKHAAICGHDGNLWASSRDFAVSGEELKALIAKYENIDQLSSSGMKVGGKKYMYISSDKEKGVVRGKLGQSGIHCIKTKQTYIICIYDEPILANQTATVTEALGEYLVGVGY